MSEIAAGMWFAGGLFVGMLVLLELGRRLRQRQRARHGENVGEGLGAIVGAVLPPEPRQFLQERFRQYVDARLALYSAIPDSTRVRAALAQGAALQQEIWGHAVKAVHEAPVPQLAGQLLPLLSGMFDLASTRLATTRIHPPPIIYGLLGVVSLLSAFLAGYGMGPSEGRSWPHGLALAAILAITIYVIVDLEYPRLGLFRVTDFDQLLVQVRAGMG